MHKTQQHHVVRSLGWHPPQNVSRRIHPLFFCFSVFLVQLMARDENLVGDLDEFSILKGRRRRRWADWLFYYKKGWATGFMSGLAECSYCVLCSSYLVRRRLDKHLHRDGRTDGRTATTDVKMSWCGLALAIRARRDGDCRLSSVRDERMKWIGPMIFLSFGGWAPSQITGSLHIAQQNMKDDLRRRRPATTTKGRRGKRSKTDDDHPWI